jgi:hypothetical protein
MRLRIPRFITPYSIHFVPTSEPVSIDEFRSGVSEPRNNFHLAGLGQSALDKSNEDGERGRAGDRFLL